MPIQESVPSSEKPNIVYRKKESGAGGEQILVHVSYQDAEHNPGGYSIVEETEVGGSPRLKILMGPTSYEAAAAEIDSMATKEGWTKID